MVTGDCTACSLFAGECFTTNGVTNQVGVHGAYFVRIQPETTDLFADLQITALTTNGLNLPVGESPSVVIETNLHVALRIQVPKDNVAFLIEAPVGDAKRECFGAIIDPR
jgi:hypothetical protein